MMRGWWWKVPATVVGATAVLVALTVVASFAISAFAVLATLGLIATWRDKVRSHQRKQGLTPDTDSNAYDRPKKPLSDDETSELKDAANTRKRGNRKEAEEFLNKLRARHPFKAKRLTDDMDWIREKAEEYGLSESALRWLL